LLPDKTKPRPFDRGSWGPAANSTRKRCRPRLGLTGWIGKGSVPGTGIGGRAVRTVSGPVLIGPFARRRMASSGCRPIWPPAIILRLSGAALDAATGAKPPQSTSRACTIPLPRVAAQQCAR
jgi:hypothetical protein